jgi:hypothetical protein
VAEESGRYGGSDIRLRRRQNESGFKN